MKITRDSFLTEKGETLILTNSDQDPSMWIIEIFRKSLFGKKKTGAYWFSHRKDAEEFVSDYLKK